MMRKAKPLCEGHSHALEQTRKPLWFDSQGRIPLGSLSVSLLLKAQPDFCNTFLPLETHRDLSLDYSFVNQNLAFPGLPCNSTFSACSAEVCRLIQLLNFESGHRFGR
jgi:hypothetical protein